MREGPTNSDRIAVQATNPPRPLHDPLMLTIVGTAVILSGLVFMMYLSWGSGKALGDTPWYIPVTHSFAGLAAFSVAFLAFGRYPVLREAASYWIGMGFSALGIQSMFFILAWPGLLPGGQGIIARLPSTSGWIAMFELASLSLALLAAVLSQWPGRSPASLPGRMPLEGRRWLLSVAAWIVLVNLICILLVVYEQYLPVLVGPQGNLTPLILSLDWGYLLLFSVGATLSARRYLRTGDALLGYVALTQLALAFVVLTAIIGAKRYDIWYYLSRVIIVGGFLSLMFGLLAEYVRLFRREREGRLALEAILENVPIGLAITGGPPDFPLDRISRHGLEMNRRPAEDLVGLPAGQHQVAWKIFLPDGITKPLPEQMPLYRASRFGEEIRNMELVMEDQDGRKIAVLVNAAPIRDGSGQIVSAINTWLDISEIKAAETLLKERNEKLRESEERYRSLFETMQEGLVAAEVITDENGNPVDYRYLDVNPATERHFGMSRDQFVGRTFTEVLPTAETEWIDILGRVALTGEPASLERYGTVTGLWFQTRAYSPRPGEFVHILTDITDRKRAEEALRLSEEKFSKAFATNPAAIAIASLQDGRVMEVNETWLAMFGYSREEVVGNTISGQLWPFMEDREWFIQELREHGSISGREQTLLRRSGEPFVTLVSAVILNVAGEEVLLSTLLDISDRKMAEEGLLQSEIHFRQLADAMPQLVWTAHPEGRVDYYNVRFREYDGIAAAPDGTWQWSPVLHPEDAQPTDAAWKRAVETGSTYQIEHRVRMAGGTYRWHLSRAVLGRDEQGRATKWFGTATDIHDLKGAEASLQKHASELERANRDLRNFTVVAAHDLQEPLRKIEALGDAVTEGALDLDQRQVDRIMRMRTSAQQMRDMVNGLHQLAFLTTDNQPFQPVDLHQVAVEITGVLDRRIQQLEGIVEIGMLPVIEADPHQMRMLLLHLIENALKFQPRGARPHVKVYSTQPEKGLVQIQVEDNGIGFDQTHAAHLFEPFERLVRKNQSEYDGIGIGLTVCRWIVERHCGEIVACSKPGFGSTFTVRLPVDQSLNLMSLTREGTKFGE